MSEPLQVGVEVAGPDVAGLLGRGLGALPEELDASALSYVVLRGPSPTVVATLLARRTQRIGIVVASSPQRDHPYNAARRVATLDHLSAGRAGQLFVDRDRALDLGVGAGTVWAPGTIGASELADAVTASRKLWRTWPVETLREGPEAHRHPIRYADHVGVFSTKGPLNVPTTPQGEPVVLWGGPVDAAAEVADVLVASEGDLGAAPPGSVRTHVRVEVTLEYAGEALRRLARRPGVDGVLLALAADAVGALGRDVLAPLVAAGVVAAPSGGTLRERLGVPHRRDPDLSGHAHAFPPVHEESA